MRYQLAKIDTSVLTVNGRISCRSSLHCYLPRRHHRPCSSWRLLIMSDVSSDAVFTVWGNCLQQKNIDDWHCNCPGQRSVVISRIDYCNAVLAGVHGVHLRQLQWFSTLQRVWSSVSTSSTAFHPRYVTSCIDCRSNSVPMYKLSNCLHDVAPVCQPCDNQSPRISADAVYVRLHVDYLAVPVTRTAHCGPCSFTALSTRNSLPASLRDQSLNKHKQTQTHTRRRLRSLYI